MPAHRPASPRPDKTRVRPVVALAGMLLGFVVAAALGRPLLAADGGPLPALPSLHGFSGLWDTPTAAILPDWHVRPAYSAASPYRIYSMSLGVLDRLELYGQFTEVTTHEAFAGEGLGAYKDRSLGAKLLLWAEDGPWPQAAIGLMDMQGTGLFSSRYFVLGKRLELEGLPVQLHLGVGQGVLAGESFFDNPQAGDDNPANASRFQLSSPWRRTRIFGGASVDLGSLLPRLNDQLHAAVEYSPMDYPHLFGHAESSAWPVNIGLKYRLWERLWAQAAWLRGREAGLGLAAELPLSPEGLYAWRREPEVETRERLRWQAHAADNAALAEIAAAELAKDGFHDIRCRVADNAVWAEAVNDRYLSDRRALRRMGLRLASFLPQRISVLYLNLVRDGRPALSLRTGRGNFQALADGRIDDATFDAFASWATSAAGHNAEFSSLHGAQGVQDQAVAGQQRFHFLMEPKIRMFLDNRRGFFKSKGFIRTAAGYEPWDGGLLAAELETVLYNDYADVAYPPLEPEPTRTDLVLYERMNGTRATMLAFDQLVELPGEVVARAAVGHFESAYAGVGAEVFRFFDGGRWGLGLEGEAVVKRSLDSALGLSEQSGSFVTALANAYLQLWPAEGVDIGLSAGRFLAGDWGARVDLRRTHRHYTVGVWYTRTDTSGFHAPENRGASDKGVYIEIPLSIFTDAEVPGRSRYTVSGFTRDVGQTVRQPRRIFPSSPDSTPARLRNPPAPAVWSSLWD